MTQKISHRERWILAILPTLAILGLYCFFVVDGLNAELEKQQQRESALIAPIKPSSPSTSLATAKRALEDARNKLAECEAQVAQLEAFVAAAPKSGTAWPNDRDAVHVIEKVETILARNNLTPLVSEAVGDGAAGTANSLIAALTAGNDPRSAHASARVWHYILDDVTPHFERALKELTREVPAVVPLSMNLVYNPDNDGETRLLELWLLY
jgi:hypothetical protein